MDNADRSTWHTFFPKSEPFWLVAKKKKLLINDEAEFFSSAGCRPGAIGHLDLVVLMLLYLGRQPRYINGRQSIFVSKRTIDLLVDNFP